jgi:hypothetical protein
LTGSHHVKGHVQKTRVDENRPNAVLQVGPCVLHGGMFFPAKGAFRLSFGVPPGTVLVFVSETLHSGFG